MSNKLDQILDGAWHSRSLNEAKIQLLKWRDEAVVAEREKIKKHFSASEGVVTYQMIREYLKQLEVEGGV